MFENLSKRLISVFDNLRGRGFISEEDLNLALRQIRIALLEADVALPVVKTFVEDIRIKSLGQEVIRSISPGQMIIKIVYDHLVELLGGTDEQAVAINLAAKAPISMMMVGLQGSGKTTSSAKLAKYLKERFKKKVLMVSLDIYRPAAQLQLDILAKSIGVDVLDIIASEKPLQIIARAQLQARQGGYDVVLYDTAGRLHIDEDLMDELKNIQEKTQPLEIMLVADAMTGQDAVSIAKGFKDVLPLTGLILTRVDGDSRGGAALSMRHITNCPIKFLGVGEKAECLEVFSAKRVADRILDMGDIVSLVERAADFQMTEEVESSVKRMEKGTFDMNDMIIQLQQTVKMGGMQGVLGFLPGAQKIKAKMDQAGINDRLLKRQIGIIHSMTQKERKNIKILNASRRRRIARGSGVEVSEVNKLVKQFEQMQVMMKRMGKMNPKAGSRHIGSMLNQLIQ